METAPLPVSPQLTKLSYESCDAIVSYIHSRSRHKHSSIGVICGSGLDKFTKILSEIDEIPYAEIPGFPISTVSGHSGNFVLGKLHGKSIACMKGRVHPYEGYDYATCAMPVRVMFLMGVRTIIITNAAGGLNPEYRIGDFMLIKDHIFFPGLAAQSPLRGPNDERFGPRFLDMSQVYDIELRKMAKQIGNDLGLTLREGIYGMAGGPQYETPSEANYLRIIGVDAVGMSTAHEAIVAKHCGMNILGLSVISDICATAPAKSNGTSHEDVLRVGEQKAELTADFIGEFIARLP